MIAKILNLVYRLVSHQTKLILRRLAQTPSAKKIKKHPPNPAPEEGRDLDSDKIVLRWYRLYLLG